jgi:hypothetical protein
MNIDQCEKLIGPVVAAGRVPASFAGDYDVTGHFGERKRKR